MTEQWPDEQRPDEHPPDGQWPDTRRPEDRDDLTQTIAFQPIDPYSLGSRPDEDDDADRRAYRPARPTLRQRAAGLGPVKLGLTVTAVVLVVVGAAWGTASALATPGDDASPGAAAAGPTATASHTAGTPRKNGAKAARITVIAVMPGSLTGTEARGAKVTVVFGDDTKFGTRNRPLSVQDLKPGDVVNVLGDLSGDTITATNIVLPAKRDPAAPPTTTGGDGG